MYGSGLAGKDMNSPDLRRKDEVSGAILSDNVTPIVYLGYLCQMQVKYIYLHGKIDLFYPVK